MFESFIDVDNAPVVPAAFSYRIDNLTTDTLILQETPVTVTSSVIDINIPAATNIINNDIGQSSQLNQVTTTTTYPDGSIDKEVFIYELTAIQVVGG